MKSEKYKNCAVIHEDYDGKYYIGFYDNNGWCNFNTTGRNVILYKTIKGAERACKKFKYNIIKYDFRKKKEEK